MIAEMDVRALLQYVPQFRERVFVVVVDVPGAGLAEVMLDLLTLQNIGVRLVIGSSVHPLDHLLDRAAEVELKFCQSGEGVEPGEHEEIRSALSRGQAVVMDFHGQAAFAPLQCQVALALGARKLILLGQGDGLPVHGALRAAEVGERDLGSSILASAARACESGIPRVHILDGSEPAVLLRELFSNEGAGTMVYADSYRGIRPVREDDIVELLGMIGRSVRRSRLVPRTYADIAEHAEDYWVMDIDGNVVGCVALLRYGGCDTGEVACLYVKQAHEGLGYGEELVKHAEQQAQFAGLRSVFALTNRAAHFFQERMGYRELDPGQIPAERHQQLVASGRDSRVFGKELLH